MSHSKPSPRSVWLILILGLLTAFDPLSIDMYLPAFPEIQKTFGVGYSTVELSLTSFFIGLAFGQLIYGPLSDRYGRKKPLAIGMTLYLLASLGCAFAPSIQVLIALRMVQAVGGCAGMVISRAMVRDLFDKRRSAQIFSLLMLVMGLAPILAPLIGGYLAKYLGWRTIFGLLGLLSLLVSIAAQIFLPETHTGVRHPLTFRSMLRTYGRLLGDRRFMGFSLSAGAVRAGMFAYITGSPFVFITLFGIKPENFGWIFGTNAFGLIAAAQINSYLLSRYSVESILGTAILAAGLASTALWMAAILAPLFWAVLIPLFIFIMTLGLIGPNSAAGALAHQGAQAGAASALMGTLQWMIAAGAGLLVSRFHDGTTRPMAGVIFGSGLLAVILYFVSNPNGQSPEPAP